MGLARKPLQKGNLECIPLQGVRGEIHLKSPLALHTSRNWPKCNYFIYTYMQLLIICDYLWKFLQLFLVLVILGRMLFHELANMSMNKGVRPIFYRIFFMCGQDI
jgi:hypothetical protein